MREGLLNYGLLMRDTLPSLVLGGKTMRARAATEVDQQRKLTQVRQDLKRGALRAMPDGFRFIHAMTWYLRLLFGHCVQPSFFSFGSYCIYGSRIL